MQNFQWETKVNQDIMCSSTLFIDQTPEIYPVPHKEKNSKIEITQKALNVWI